MQASETRLPIVFISHSASDSDFANRMEQKLAELGVTAWNFNTQVGPGDAYLDKAKHTLETCTHIMVLVGPVTKESRWVDMEMEIAMASSESGPGADLIGVILPNHGDFTRPYYEPDQVPARLHDFVRQGAAVIKKWSEDPSEVSKWIAGSDSLGTGLARSCRPSLATLKFIRENAWTDEGDIAREGLPSLSAQHIRPE